MRAHFIIYGLIGMLMEIVWTALGSLISGDVSLTGHTYIWMFFIYGLAIFFEPIHDRIRTSSILVRGLIWVFLIYVIEFTTGFTLKMLLGACPWDYSEATNLTLGGFIRFDYAPAWFVAGMLFEKLHDWLEHVQLSSSKV